MARDLGGSLDTFTQTSNKKMKSLGKSMESSEHLEILFRLGPDLSQTFFFTSTSYNDCAAEYSEMQITAKERETKCKTI